MKQQSHLDSGRRLCLGEVYSRGGLFGFSSSSIGLRGYLSPLGFGFFNIIKDYNISKILLLLIL